MQCRPGPPPGEYKQEAGDAGQLALLFLLLLAAFAGFWRRRVWIATTLWLLLNGGWLLACHMAYERGVILHVLWVPAGVTVLHVGCIAAIYIRAALEQRQITGTFKRYAAMAFWGAPLPQADFVMKAVRAAADALEGRIRVTSLGDSVKLKGKQDGFEVLTMDGIL